MTVLEDGKDFCVKRRKKGTQLEVVTSTGLTRREALRMAHRLNGGPQGQGYVFTVDQYEPQVIDAMTLSETSLNAAKIQAGKLPRISVPKGTIGFDW